MTEQHECEWGPWHPWCSTYRCVYPGCYKNMPSEEVAKRLNEYETLKKATEALKPAWVCEFCFACLLEGDLPTDWDLVFQSAICPSCQKKVAQDGGYHNVPGGSYSDGRKDPRADILEGK